MIIPPTWPLPETLRNRLSLTTYGRQRAIVEEGHLLLVLHKPPGPDDATREGVLFWRNPSGDWQGSRGGSGVGAVKRHVQSYAEAESRLMQQFEQTTDTAVLFDVVEAVTPLVRAGRNMHQAFQTAREAIKGDAQVIELRDLAYEVERNLELLIEDVHNAIRHKMARESEQQSQLTREALRASHRLNILGALFFPLTAIASVFSMNFSHGLDEHRPAIFWLVFAVGAALGFGMKGWVLGSDNARSEPSKTGSKTGSGSQRQG